MIELKLLILAQIAVDVVIAIIFVFLIRKLRSFGKGLPVKGATRNLEQVLQDADKLAEKFGEHLNEKRQLIRNLNEQLDKRIVSLNVLLNRTGALLSSHDQKSNAANEKPFSMAEQPARIMGLAEQGHSAEEIARLLSVPQGEVKLVLDLKQKLSALHGKEGDLS